MLSTTAGPLVSGHNCRWGVVQCIFTGNCLRTAQFCFTFLSAERKLLRLEPKVMLLSSRNINILTAHCTNFILYVFYSPQRQQTQKQQKSIRKQQPYMVSGNI